MKLKLVKFLSPSLIVLPIVVNATSCSGSAGIVFGNFESYMSPSLIEVLQKEVSNSNFLSYSTNEDIQIKFKKYYDIAIPSTYTVLELIKDKELAKFDWSKFNVEMSPDRTNNQHPPLQNPSDRPTGIIQNAKQAEWLFSDTVDRVIDSVDEYAHQEKIYDNNESLLDYALPYFLQDLMFAYHGSYIDSLPSPSTLHDDPNDNRWYSNTDWNNITNVISKKNNPNFDQRFTPSNLSKMMMIDDSRTVYDYCHLIHTNNAGINPSKEEENIRSITNVYKSLTDKYDPNTFRLNSDSYQVMYSFATPLDKKQPTLAEANGIISYNGDALNAITGGGNPDWINTWSSDDSAYDGHMPDHSGNTHIVKPLNTPVMMDMLVMNKKDQGTNKETDLYKMLRTVALDGCQLSWQTTQGSSEQWIGSQDDEGNWIYQTTNNFSYVVYNPPLWNLNTFVSRDEEVSTEYNSYFDKMYKDLPEQERNNKAELCAEINTVNFSNGLLELPLDSVMKSDMSMVYTQYKEQM